MSTNPLVQLHSLGQSVWLDQMRRSLLSTGELRRLIENDGLRGLTSNPTIFEKAISGSQDYAEQLASLAHSGNSVSHIYEDLVVQDIGGAADAFRGVYDASDGGDGFVSLEVSPLLANDTKATIEEARKLFVRLNRPNVMIKVPGTPAGLPAIEELIASGLNINVTLIFAVEVYEQVAEAYIKGLERRAAAGQPVDRIGSVASFFVSRIDSMVDKQLEQLAEKATDDAQKQRINALMGKAAIANAKLAYESFKRIFTSERFAALRAKGAKVQRPLWASTSTKNPAYPDTMYADELIGPDTVDTLPPQTVEAFRDHGKVAPTLDAGIDEARHIFDELKAVGIDMKAVTDKLTEEGVKSFSESFEELIKVIEARRDEVVRGTIDRHAAALGGYENDFNNALRTLEKENAVARIWKKDPTLWKTDPEHQQLISNSLGWLTVAETMQPHVGELVAFAEEIRKAGFEFAVVLGMGGSSLCTEVLARTFSRKDGYPQLYVLDSTVPTAIRHLEQKIKVGNTLFIVSSKSGATTEPQMFHRYFYDRVKRVKGDSAGENFVAISDPGAQLVRDASRDRFRRVFLNMPDIGGRYSALSYFGMVPFAIMGGDVKTLLTRAAHTAHACASLVGTHENPGARLGAILGSLANAGRNKLTFILPSPLASLGLWIEQLIAESTGKEGRGIVPVAGEPLGPPEVYGDDRVFVYIHTRSAKTGDIEQKLAALEAAGHPVLRHALHDLLDLGEEFFLWEFATAVAGALIGIDPFDQPNVQESKDNTRRLLTEHSQNGSLTQQSLIVADNTLRVFGDAETRDALRRGGSSLQDIITAHVARINPGDYLAITQFIEELNNYDALLQEIRVAIRDEKKVATTTGYGPRFLHSTGQLHKGGPDCGVFIQITSSDINDMDIPGEKFTFGVLKQAQALGDFEALAARHRRAIRVDLGGDVEKGLRRLLTLIKGAVSPAPVMEVAQVSGGRFPY
ncbi:MAG TPA: bifunctional transaldolase/phosoglucose isomerase [Terriglobales bacterium]|nr:bifunctional transaldolase/phosoglucose isomerase [Terriglobales bacterium]